jgi:TonB-linked SusC/RagA family outer membrane protein
MYIHYTIAQSAHGKGAWISSKHCLLMLLLVACFFPSMAQERVVTGKVTDGATQQPMPGVSILIKGTSSGTTTDAGGSYSLNIPGNESVLVFSFIGYVGQEIALGNRTVVDLSLTEDVTSLNEVVVTALGVERSQKTLTYNTQQVGTAELTTVKDANLMNSLTGKMAGLSISRTSGGVGGSVKLLLRGQRSAQGNNAPLIVVDGVPVSNYTPGQASSQWGGQDGGDGLSNINPEDVESVNVLKGASASALYGSDAANGVIIITTKKGKAGKETIDFSSNMTVETPLIMPKFQNTYGQIDPTSGISNFSWSKTKSPSIAGNGDYSSFFRTGTTLINNISFSSGTEKAQTYASYSNTKSNGILPTNDLTKHTFNLRSVSKFLNDKLTVDGKITYTAQTVNNRPSSGFYFNPLTGLYMFPRDVAIQPYLDQYEKLDPVRGLQAQNWPFSEDYQQNPTWILNRNPNTQELNRFIVNLNLKYNFTNWLSLQARGNLDKNNIRAEHKVYATTQGTLSDANGRWQYGRYDYQEMYGDMILNANRSFNNLAINFLVGTSIKDKQGENIDLDTKGAGEYGEGLIIPNIFTLENTGRDGLRTQSYTHRQTQSVFASTQLGYKEVLFLDLTARNDWDSSLPKGNYSFFYPSIGLSGIISDMVTMPTSINFLKARISYAQVGNGIADNFVANNLPAHLDRLGQVSGINTTAPFNTLKPEISSSFEFGFDLKLLDNRIGLDFTYYNTSTVNQYFRLPSNSVGTKYSFFYVNAGEIVNNGFEGVVRYTPIKTSKLTWNMSINFSSNKNTIVSLDPTLKGKYYLNGGGADSYTLAINEGGSYGDMYSYVLKPASNGGVYGAAASDGTINNLSVSSSVSYIGNTQPKALVGFRNEFAIGRFAISLLIDSRFGGKFMSMTEAFLKERGVAKVTGDVRDAGGFVNLDVYDETSGQKIGSKVDAQLYYQKTGGRGGALGSENVFDATNVRVRELSIGYQIPVKGVFKTARVSLVGRNLFFLYNESPYDPEMIGGTGNNFVGIDSFGLPPTRSMGINVNLSF